MTLQTIREIIRSCIDDETRIDAEFYRGRVQAFTFALELLDEHVAETVPADSAGIHSKEKTHE